MKVEEMAKIQNGHSRDESEKSVVDNFYKHGHKHTHTPTEREGGRQEEEVAKEGEWQG